MQRQMQRKREIGAKIRAQGGVFFALSRKVMIGSTGVCAPASAVDGT
jgi:hypothetical protein